MLKTAERYFFFLVVLLNLIPVFSGKFFPTLDGPAHLYSSGLIGQLLGGQSSVLNDFFVFNPEPVPNWTGHLLLIFFNSFLPAFVAEKMLLVFYLIVFPLAFRALLLTVSPHAHLMSYLIFPFSYSYFFFLGFYNFCLALVFLMLTLRFWLRHEAHLFSLKTGLRLFALLALTYFSHIFVFAILMLFIGLQLILKTLMQIGMEPKQLKALLVTAVKKCGMLLLSASVLLALFFYYFYTRPSSDYQVFLSGEELRQFLVKMSPLVAVSATREEPYTTVLFYLIVLLALVAALTGLVRRIRGEASYESATLQTGFWLFPALLLLGLYFIVPDTYGTAGYISTRLGLLFFLVLLIWIASRSIPNWITAPIALVFLYCNFAMNTFYKQVSRSLGKVAAECVEASAFIEPGSVVLPLNYSGNWLHTHFSNYLGIDKPVVILECYECQTDYFPLKWNPLSPDIRLGDRHLNDFPCVQRLYETSGTQTHSADYVFMLGAPDPAAADPCTVEIIAQIETHYTLVFEAESCRLYRSGK